MAKMRPEVAGGAGWERLSLQQREILRVRDKIAALIRSNGGGDAAELLAVPEFGADGDSLAGWRSPHGGELRATADPSAHRALAARIEQIAERLEGQGDAGRLAGYALRAALVTPDGAEAHFVDSETGRPVLANWGMAAPGQPRPTLSVAAAPEPRSPGRPPAATSARAAGPVAGPEPAHAPGPALPDGPPPPATAGAGWLAAAAWLVPAGLAALAGWLFVQSLAPAPVEIVTLIPDAPPAADPTAGLAERLAALDAGLAEAAAAAGRFAGVCVDPPPAHAVAPAEPPAALPAATGAQPGPPPAEPAPEALALAPAIETPRSPVPDPRPPRREPVQASAPPAEAVEAPAPAVEPAPQASARAACNPSWPPGRSPRMVFVVDGSGSMEEGIRGAPSRMAAAKSSIGRVVRALHDDIRIGLVSFSDCGATRHSRYYGAAERGQALANVNAISPGRMTSLASSITRAGAMATRRADTVIVVVSDGEDTCGRDACAAARAVSASNITINVIDLGDGSAAGTLQCIARAGRGRVFRPDSAAEMASQIQQATGQPDASGC